MSPPTTVFATLTGVYGGYFGAGAGVMMVAVLGLGTDLELRIINGLKTLALMVGNIVAGLIFVVAADPRWDVVVLLATGSLVGGASAASCPTRSSAGRSSPPAWSRRCCCSESGSGQQSAHHPQPHGQASQLGGLLATDLLQGGG